MKKNVETPLHYLKFTNLYHLTCQGDAGVTTSKLKNSCASGVKIKAAYKVPNIYIQELAPKHNLLTNIFY